MRNTRLSVRERRRLLVRLASTSSFTVDVGRGGFCISLLRVLPVGAQFEGSILVSGRDLPFAAEVTWSRPGDHRLGLPGRMGAAFKRIADGFASAIRPARREPVTAP